MLKKILTLSILSALCMISVSGCSNPFRKEKPKKANPYVIHVASKKTLKDDTYYIKHGDQFYEIPIGDYSYGDDYIRTDNDTPEGDNSRTVFYTKDKTELAMPTMYADDELVYKSSDTITDKFNWERYIDGGYTIGIRGLTENNIGTLNFTNYEKNFFHKNNIVKQLGSVDSEDSENLVTYTLDAIDNKKLINVVDGVPEKCKTLSTAGYITGLAPGKEVVIDIYKGTQLYKIKTKTDVRIFYDFEEYATKGVTYSTDGYAVINVLPGFMSGYYKVNNSGIFRYINQNYDESINIDDVKYNMAYFKYDKNGNIVYKTDKDGYPIYE